MKETGSSATAAALTIQRTALASECLPKWGDSRFQGAVPRLITCSPTRAQAVVILSARGSSHHLARLGASDLRIDTPRQGQRAAQPWNAKRLLHLNRLPQLELSQLLQLCDLGRHQLNELLKLVELLKLLELKMLELLQLLRQQLQLLERLLQRLGAVRAHWKTAERLAGQLLKRKWIDARSLRAIRHDPPRTV